MKRFLCVVIGLAATCIGRANADVTYDFEAGQSNYSASPGQSLSIPIYLKETLTNGSASQITKDGGLFSFGLTLALNSGGGQINGLDRNPAFDQRDNGSTTTFPATPVKLWAEQNNNFPNGPVPDPSTGLVPLATLTYQAPTSGTSTFGISDFNAATTETLTYAFTDLDASITPGSFSVTVGVPEPTSIGAAATGLTLLGRRRRR